MACRKLAGQKIGRELSKAEFARMCENDERYYTNIENGADLPGRILLEAAAKLAGLTFEDCIKIPVSTPTKHESALSIFTDALSDWRESVALEAAVSLAALEKPRRPKYGGRTRKK